jgi:hypothetical protein
VPAAAKRAFDAMMRMRKIDIAAIEAARCEGVFCNAIECLVAKMCAIKNFLARCALGANSTQYRDIARNCNDTHNDAKEF